MEATADHPFSDLRMKPVRQKIWLPDAALHLNCAAVSGLFPAEGRGHCFKNTDSRWHEDYQCLKT